MRQRGDPPAPRNDLSTAARLRILIYSIFKQSLNLMQMPVHVPLEGPTEKKGFFIYGPIVAVAGILLVFL